MFNVVRYSYGMWLMYIVYTWMTCHHELCTPQHNHHFFGVLLVMGTEADRVDEEICKEAANFTKIFYDAMDRKREKINYLYCDSGATLVWNGNPVSGCDNIFKFISSLPETDHHLVSVDVQRINAGLPGSTNLLTITTAGTVILGGAVHGFTHVFVLTIEDGKYKVRSERFRYVD